MGYITGLQLSISLNMLCILQDPAFTESADSSSNPAIIYRSPLQHHIEMASLVQYLPRKYSNGRCVHRTKLVRTHSSLPSKGSYTSSWHESKNTGILQLCVEDSVKLCVCVCVSGLLAEVEIRELHASSTFHRNYTNVIFPQYLLSPDLAPLMQ